MVSPRIPISVHVSYKEIRDGIGKIIVDKLNKAIKGSVNPVSIFVEVRVRQAILNSPEYKSMASGQLEDEIGIPNLEDRLNRIISYWASNLQVKHNPVKLTGNKITGGMSVRMIQANYKDVISLDDANFLTEHGDNLPWLEWMLLRGAAAIVLDYEIGLGLGRAGQNIMIKNTSSSWSIPPQFSGLKDDNFITRALAPLHQEIADFMERQITVRIN